MRVFFRWMGPVALMFVMMAVPLGAQPAGGGQGAPPNRMYDPSTVVEVKGSVLRVDQAPSSNRGGFMGVHLLLQVESAKISVHLGPAWFLRQKGIRFQKGDRLEVRGSRVEMPGGPVIIAAVVKKGGQTFRLRDDGGLPLWSRRGQP